MDPRALAGIAVNTTRSASDQLAPGTSTTPITDKLNDIGGWLALAPLIYTLNVLFFIPEGDELLRWTLLPAVVLGLYVRRRRQDWSMGDIAPLLQPLLIYTVVLVAWTAALGGFASTLRAWAFVCLFLYFAAPLLRASTSLRYAVMLAGLELAALAGYQHHIVGIERINGYTNPLFIAMFAFCIAILNLYLASTARSIRTRSLFVVAALAAFYAVALTQGRGIAIAAIVVIPLFGTFLLHHTGFRRHRLGFALSITALLAALFLAGGIGERFQRGQENLLAVQQAGDISLADQENSVGFRFMMWRFAFEQYLQHPLVGLGKDRFEAARQAYIEQGAVSPAMQELFAVAHTHNQYLQELVMRGLPGLIAMLGMFVALLLLGLNMARHTPWAGYALASLILAFAVFGLTEVTLKHSYKIYTLCFLCLAVFVMAKRDDTSLQNDHV